MWEERLNKLNEQDRERVIQFRDDGMTNRAIAKRFNVSDATVSRILDEEGKSAKPGGWGHREGDGEV
jgi:DNA invertase Pin-like site-specific DNA recombinase